MRKLIILSILTLIAFQAVLAKEGRLLRYPNTSDTHITFCCGGDVYTVPIEGGLARQITTSKGYEMFPRFSPDGKTIAFSAEYDGNREVYTMPATGGTPERITYTMDMGSSIPARMGPNKIVMGWTNDGGKILYRSRKESWNPFIGKLWLVDKDGGLPDDLPLPRGGFASYSPDGSKLAYNRIFREYRTWKRYRGGMANDVWIHDFNSRETINITDNDAQDIIPMWHRNKVYYLSDRDGRMNLYVYKTETEETEKLTNYTDYDIKFPSIGPSHIAFEKGGYIYLMELATEQINQVNIEIAGDFPYTRNEIAKVKDKIKQFEIAPDAKRALFSARGDVFTVPEKKGKIRNLTESAGAHDRSAVWSPDGKWLAYISDKDGKNEIYIMKGDGSDVIQLTDDADTYRYSLEWSPDSRKILCSDKKMRLYYINIENKKQTQVKKSDFWEIRNYTWSPDSKWIAYTDYLESETPVIYLYDLENDESHKITGDFFRSAQPEFSENGKYLFFLSDRTFKPKLGSFELNYIYENMTTIFGLTLQDTVESPFAFESDEVEVEDSKSKSSKKDDDGDLRIDLDGLQDRLFEFPVDAANYTHLTSVDNKLYYVKNEPGKKPAFYVYDLEKQEEKQIGEFSGYEISRDGKKILFKHDKDYYIEKLDAKVKPEDGKLDLSNMKSTVNHREEWNQIFHEAWRQLKWFFYAPNMHGLDWEAVREKYEPLLPHVVHRKDLTYVIGEMIGELNCGHSYVGGGGEMTKVDPVNIGLLGIDFELDRSSGFYRIMKIYPGRSWDENTRSPLTEPGIKIDEGDYIIAIDGKTMTSEYHPYKACVDKVKEYVTLKVNDEPQKQGAEEYTVKTIKSENGIRYLDWVEKNRKKVDSMTNGKVGYVHIPNMMTEGLNEFVKYFYPQIRKEGLIVDVRFNGGGFVSQMIIERLNRILTMVGNARNSEHVSTYPDAVFTGPMVCMLNQFSASDGDIFPYNFKQNNLGKLVGKRSWGGVIGIRGSLPLLDGSYLYKPEFSHFSADGEWILEGVGMSPDIEVDNDPAKEYQGIDQQLNKAVEVILEEIEIYEGPTIPEVPEYPDRSK